MRWAMPRYTGYGEKMDNSNTIEVNRDFIEKCAPEIADFSVSFVNLSRNQDRETANLGGSGTLVYAGGKHAILTADHVLDNLPTRGEVGLTLSSVYRPILHRFSFYMEDSRKITIARGIEGSEGPEGPDLGIVIISEVTANRIEDNNKIFYNLEKRRNRIIQNPSFLSTGIWYLCGMPVEWTEELPEQGMFKPVMVFRGACGEVNIPTEEVRGAFDYLYLDIEISESYKGPISFNGVSGGGLIAN